MNTIRLLTDSIANLPHEVIIENQIEVVPVNIIIDDKVYKDTELTLDDYFKLITDAQGKNKLNSNTSFPSPGDFAEAYVRLAQAGATHIISVHVSRKASGIEWSVLTAKTLVESKVRVHFVKPRSEEHTSELQSPDHLVCRLLLEKKKINQLSRQCGRDIVNNVRTCASHALRTVSTTHG